MRLRRTTARLMALLAAVLVLAACSDDGETTNAGDLEATEVGGESPTGDGSEESTAATEGEDGGEPTGTGGDAAGVSADLVDTTEAVAGTWPVGNAGTVSFAIVDAALVLEDVTAADGWRAEVEQEADEIEVDFHRGNVEWEIEIQLEDGGTLLEVEINQEIEAAEPGSYDLGDAGTFTFDVQDAALVLTDLTADSGWTVTEQDERAVKIEFELASGAREFDVEIELVADGTNKVEIDYEVEGPVAQ